MELPKRIHIIFSIKNDGRGNPSPTAQQTTGYRRQTTDCRKKILRRVAPQYDKTGGTTDNRRQTTDDRFATKDDSYLQSRK